ncbi:Mth938-like domain-containing protein [Dactylosporangium sp. AC04546]|uniref:Mth938-like domain-containing protein n=1 Tax=Dactylosporangium sp. AC04546 TaxID=2862460 RepID=UPI001EE0BFC0|nr:Mth938-like domain-containing protein [Dactylosporangium sp. AC04546]WVK87607.1 Mth938-like domain-containing protein [Dactylosporangium sp. AC04546]
MHSPRILASSWGKLHVEGLGVVKDLKAWPGGAREWDWSDTGTSHSPGIQFADVEELLDHGATVVVLSQGMEERLEVPDETVEALESRGVEVHVAPTPEAIALYNDLTGTAPVGGLFHSTC